MERDANQIKAVIFLLQFKSQPNQALGFEEVRAKLDSELAYGVRLVWRKQPQHEPSPFPSGCATNHLQEFGLRIECERADVLFVCLLY